MVICGRYRLLCTIGQGGMGTVWQAHDEVLGRDVAVKEVLPPRGLSEQEREMFNVRTFREARAAGRVSHPGVATVYDVVEERGHPWIVMQLVPSATLGERVREHGPLPVPQVASIGIQVLEALHASHEAGVVHRDVKPDNVLLSEDGRAVLTDFGIATTEDEVPVTRTGELVGTPAFMAPERAAGGRARPASDLWSLGATLFFAVEGQSPFRRETALTTLGAVLHAEPPPMSRAGALAPVLSGLLRKDPVERLTLREAERRIAAVVAGHPLEPTGPVAEESRQRVSGPAVPVRRRVAWAGALAAGTVVVALATGTAAWLYGRTDPPPVLPSSPAVVTNSFTATVRSTATTFPATPYPTTPPSTIQSSHPVRPSTTGTTPAPKHTPKKTKTKKPKPTATESTDQVEPSDG
ncbi:serine/threonine-protein kinase [Nonomuraea sediminis]|uniref:serine/threonine-protein kinase n=1 Tax=Nonomuraea sediminis TaxID=2835864 RepID=UPI001BDCABD1|nr:serine/threonine-protein kinase [Nonomuraea sediminis]